jgi:peroxiredoxin
MNLRRCALVIALVSLASPVLLGQANLSAINKQLKSLAAPPEPQMPGAPSSKPGSAGDDQRPATILQLAKDIKTLPAGAPKVKAADTLVQAAGEGEATDEAMQAATDTLAQALSETPQQPGKDGLPVQPYMDLARLVVIGGMKTTFSDPMLAKAEEITAANRGDAAKADFTLKDANGKKVTLSALRGKIVLVNFWAIQCASCKKEMQDLDLIYTHYQEQGLVILSITGDNPFATASYLASKGYHPAVLFDDGKVGKAFHVDQLHPEGLPRSFVFDRDGKLVAESVGTCTQRQFFSMLAMAGLQPSK